MTTSPSLRQNAAAADVHPSPDAVAGRTAPTLLRVVRGNPTPEQLAALIAVVAARGAVAEESPRPRSLWSAPVLRFPLPHGPGAWRASAGPR